MRVEVLIMNIHAFYFPVEPKEEELLKGEIFRHLKVLRVKQKEKVILFDGKGLQTVGIITEIDKKKAVFKTLEKKRIPPRPFAVTIGVALPKGKRQAFLVEKLAELCVERFIPLITSRTIVRPRSTVIERLQKISIEGASQSRNPYVMKIEQPMAVDEAVQLSDFDMKLIAIPEGKCFKDLIHDKKPTKVFCIVGPEGGFTENEIRLAVEQGFEPVTLGRELLRIETAAIALAAIINHELG
ncbi:MAG: RsmE family RNA methyltransferase [Candidatus Woesearchaeota archaeon]